MQDFASPLRGDSPEAAPSDRADWLSSTNPPISRPPMTRGGSFLHYVHSMRGFAILSVVAVHVADAEGWGRHDAAFAQHFLWSLFGNATVLFVFVSGFLFQHLSTQFRYRSYLGKRFTNVVVPYLVVSTPTLVSQYLRGNGVFEGAAHENPLWVALRACLTGAQMATPLWYVPVIVVYFVAAPLFVALDRQPRWYWLLAPLFLVAGVAHRSGGHRVVWQSALYFVPVYLLGMLVSHYREAALAWIAKWRAPLLAVSIAAFVLQVAVVNGGGPVYSRRPFSMEAGVFDFDLLCKTALALCSLEWFRRHDQRVRAWFSSLGDASFGVFFLHGYLLQVLMGRPWWTRLSGSWWSLYAFPLCALGVAAVALLCARLTRRLLGSFSRFAIGC